MTSFTVSEVEVEPYLGNVAGIPVLRLDIAIKLLTAPVFETGIGYLLCIE
jgi:hypothetical protein